MYSTDGSIKQFRLCPRKSKGKKAFEAKDVEWHLKNCLDSQFDPWSEILQVRSHAADKHYLVCLGMSLSSAGSQELHHSLSEELVKTLREAYP